jgi:hypothetical protein
MDGDALEAVKEVQIVEPVWIRHQISPWENTIRCALERDGPQRKRTRLSQRPARSNP